MVSIEPIAQVLVVPLKKVVNERGHLLEVQRNDDAHFLGFGQLYVTLTHPGVVKAWYRHRVQLDQIALISGALRLVMYDAREKSPTRGSLQEIDTDSDRPVLVQIPSGLWHGFKAVGPEPAVLAHLNTVPFDFRNTDEERLAPDDPSVPYRW